MSHALLIRNILIMITDLCLCRWCVDRLRKLIGLLESLRQLNATNRAILLITCPAASGDISSNDTLDWKHLQLAAHHAVTVKLRLLEEFRHILHID